jgi:predicted RNase H-like HicB family nuclease
MEGLTSRIMVNKSLQKDRSFIRVDYGISGELAATRGWVGIEARLSFSIRKRAGSYIAACPELHLKDQGDTPREAFDNIVDMILALLSDAIGSDELADVLDNFGYVKRGRGNRQEFSREREAAELPLSFKATAEWGRRIPAAKLAWVG